MNSNPIGSNIKNPLNVLNPQKNPYKDVTNLPLFISNLLKLLTIGAGIFVMINFVLAGFNYVIANGDEKKLETANSMMINSIIGLAIIAASYVITGIISYLIFGDPTTILHPKIYGPGTIKP